MTSTKNSAKYDMWLYRCNYGIQGLFLAFMSTFFPIYLTNVALFTPLQITQFVFITQFPLLLKPLFGVINDKMVSVHPRFPFQMLFLSLGSYVVAMILLGALLATINNIIITVFILVVYLSYSLFDTIIDFIIVSKQKNDNATTVANMQFFSRVGNLIISQVYLLTIGTNISGGPWMVFFITFAIAGSGFLLVALLHPQKMAIPVKTPPTPSLQEPSKNLTPIERKLVLLMIGYCIGFQIPTLMDYVVEPYLVAKFSAEGFNLYTSVLIYSSLATLPIYFFLTRFRAWVYPRRVQLVVISGLYAVANWIVLGLIPLSALLVMAVFTGLMDHIVYFAFLSILIDSTPHTRKATYYQTFAFIHSVAGLVFRALGPLMFAQLGVTSFILVGIFVLGFLLPIILMMRPLLAGKE